MEKHIIENNKWLWLFVIVTYLSCTPKNEKAIPDNIIFKSVEYTVRKYKKYLYPKVYIIKNTLTKEARTINIDGIELSLIDENIIKSSETSTIEFYKFNRMPNNQAEIELVVMPRRQYIRFHFKKTLNQKWDLLEVMPWQD